MKNQTQIVEYDIERLEYICNNNYYDNKNNKNNKNNNNSFTQILINFINKIKMVIYQ